MILYFTGTGNSLYAAQKLADEGEEIVSLVEAQRSKAFYCTLQEGEKLGFVFCRSCHLLLSWLVFWRL